MANPSWVNFLKEFIDFHIIQNEETGEIFAVSEPSEGQVPLKWGNLNRAQLQNGQMEEITRNVSPEDIEQAYDYLCFLENTYTSQQGNSHIDQEKVMIFKSMIEYMKKEKGMSGKDLLF